ncbi:MAG TPA: TonB-dependent receptor [Caldimonas sp.]|nr:TonB-dependent receptor [Caldimonas sp.]
MHCRPLLAAAALIVSQTAEVQAQDSTRPEQVLEKVRITGSNVPRRTDSETPAPVQVVTREEIVRSGAASLQEVLQRLPANNVGTFNDGTTVDTYGAATVSLRGLGPGSTLVLINGRRVAPFGFTGKATYVDVNQIPVAAIERVEVLLDGASAIYGSDAIAGVVNVILRRSYRGIEVAGGLGTSTHGDADERRASATFGVGDRGADGYNVFASVSHVDQDAVKASARWHTQSYDLRGFGLPDLRSPQSYPGNLYTSDNRRFLQPLPGCATIGDATSANPGQCLYDHTRDSDAVVRSRRDALFVAGNAALGGSGFELFGDAAFSRNVFAGQHYTIASTNLLAVREILPRPFITLPVGHPQNPSAGEVALRTRFADQPLVVTPTTDTERIVLGLRRDGWAGWDVESALLWSHSHTRTTTTGSIRHPVLTGEILDANGVAPPTFRFGDPAANDPALMARLYPQLVDLGRTSTASIDVRGSRDLFRLGAGRWAQLAVGAELRRERFDMQPDPLTAAGEIVGIFAPTAAGSRTVASAYGELALPLTATVEGTLAARWDHYSDFGSTVNPKFGVKWRAAPNVALRATYSSAFRAPALSETSQQPVPGGAPVRDPKLCPVPDPVNPNCDIFVPAVSSGNPALKPERAWSATAGIVFEPWRDTSFTVDAFSIRRRDQIDYIDPAFLLDHEADYPGYVVRNPDGTLKQLNVQYTNLAESRVWGIDMSARARTTIANVGNLGIDGSYEWLPHYWVAQTPGSPLVEWAGFYEQPKSRARVALSFDRGPWRSSLAWNYTAGYQRASTGSDPSCPYATTTPALCSVGRWSTFDAFFGYADPKFEIGLVVNNVGNVQAPFDERFARSYATAYDPAYHSAVGRFFRLTAKYVFR